VAQLKLKWQSKAILLLVLPAVAADVVLQAHWWALEASPVAFWVLGLSLLLGLVAWKVRAATAAAAFAGSAITASLMFSTATVPYVPWQTGLVPVMAVLILTSIATRFGRRRKEQLGTAEHRRGRRASQVAANLGVATLVSNELAQSLFLKQGWIRWAELGPTAVFAASLAALCEAAADTVSSELGQLFSSHPRMITNLRVAEAGTDGAISLGGTVAGTIAAGIVALSGTIALRGHWTLFLVSWTGGVFGLFFDSLLGGTLERHGWLNNDAVNFVSTFSSAGFALAILAVLPNGGAF
jgi:uncharacterized protein (TIGR00297 family)